MGSHKAALAKNKYQLYISDPDNSLIWDVDLLCDDGTRVKANRGDLMAASPFFRAMFSRARDGDDGAHHHPYKEARQGEIAIPGVPGTVLQGVVKHVYSGEPLPLADDASAPAFLEIADRLQLDDAKREACEHLRTHLSPITALPTYLLAERHSCGKLRAAAAAYVGGHLQEVAAESPLDALREVGREGLLQLIEAAPLNKRRGAVLLDLAATLRQRFGGGGGSGGNGGSREEGNGSHEEGNGSGSADGARAAANSTPVSRSGCSNSEGQQEDEDSPAAGLSVADILPHMELDECTMEQLQEVGEHPLFAQSRPLQLQVMGAVSAAADFSAGVLPAAGADEPEEVVVHWQLHCWPWEDWSPGERWESPRFRLPGAPEGCADGWSLDFYPQGYSEESKGWVSLFLSPPGPLPAPVTVRYSLFVVNHADASKTVVDTGDATYGGDSRSYGQGMISYDDLRRRRGFFWTATASRWAYGRGRCRRARATRFCAQLPFPSSHFHAVFLSLLPRTLLPKVSIFFPTCYPRVQHIARLPKLSVFVYFYLNYLNTRQYYRSSEQREKKQ